jgi:hypothetical protein
MKCIVQKLKVAGCLLAAGLLSGTAMAQQESSATASAKFELVKPIAITKSSDLSFGRIVAITGTVTVSEVTSARAATPSTMLVMSSGVGGDTIPTRASFNVTGAPNLTYAVSAPAATLSLTNGTAAPLAVTLTGVYADSSKLTATAATASIGTLSAAGSDILSIGGSLYLTAAATPGVYTSADGISLTVNYN